MRKGAPGHQHKPSSYGPADDTYLHRLHEQMLNRYGIGYVCEHPEILFGKAVALHADPDQRGYGVPQAAEYIATSPGREGPHSVYEDAGDALVDRMNQALHILNEIYAPPRPATVGSPRFRPHYPASQSSIYSRRGRFRREYG